MINDFSTDDVIIVPRSSQIYARMEHLSMSNSTTVIKAATAKPRKQSKFVREEPTEDVKMSNDKKIAVLPSKWNEKALYRENAMDQWTRIEKVSIDYSHKKAETAGHLYFLHIHRRASYQNSIALVWFLQVQA